MASIVLGISASFCFSLSHTKACSQGRSATGNTLGVFGFKFALCWPPNLQEGSYTFCILRRKSFKKSQTLLKPSACFIFSCSLKKNYKVYCESEVVRDICGQCSGIQCTRKGKVREKCLCLFILCSWEKKREHPFTLPHMCLGSGVVTCHYPQVPDGEMYVPGEKGSFDQ